MSRIEENEHPRDKALREERELVEVIRARRRARAEAKHRRPTISDYLQESRDIYDDWK